jgi:SAM-dependent methyltransferase
MTSSEAIPTPTPRPDWSREQVARWIDAQGWYQTIDLGDGLATPGRYDSRQRLADLALPADLAGRSVLDVGCNSGMYCFECKRRNAGRVVGIDLNRRRLAQARALNEYLGLDVVFHEMPLGRAHELGSFDVVFCFAVVTEIPDLLGSLGELAAVTRGTLYLELALFESARRYRLLPGPLRRLALRLASPAPPARLRKSGDGWSLAPSLALVREVFGSEFALRDLGPSLRYHLVALGRVAARPEGAGE